MMLGAVMAPAWFLPSIAFAQTSSNLSPVWQIKLDHRTPTSFSFRSDLFGPTHSSFDRYHIALPSLRFGNASRFQFGAVSRFGGWNLKEITRGFHFAAESRDWWKDGNGWGIQDRTIEFRFAIGG